jgi:hypothetical protein
MHTLEFSSNMSAARTQIPQVVKPRDTSSDASAGNTTPSNNKISKSNNAPKRAPLLSFFMDTSSSSQATPMASTTAQPAPNNDTVHTSGGTPDAPRIPAQAAPNAPKRAPLQPFTMAPSPNSQATGMTSPTGMPTQPASNGPKRAPLQPFTMRPSPSSQTASMASATAMSAQAASNGPKRAPLQSFSLRPSPKSKSACTTFATGMPAQPASKNDAMNTSNGAGFKTSNSSNAFISSPLPNPVSKPTSTGLQGPQLM